MTVLIPLVVALLALIVGSDGDSFDVTGKQSISFLCEHDQPVDWKVLGFDDISSAMNGDSRISYTFYNVSGKERSISSCVTVTNLSSKDVDSFTCYQANDTTISDTSFVTLPKVDSDLSSTGLITGICLAALLIIILLIFVIIRKHNQTKKMQSRTFQEMLKYFESGQPDMINPKLPIEEQADLLPYNQRWEFPRNNLKIGRQLGVGQFGRVVQAEAINLRQPGTVTSVAVKMSKSHGNVTGLEALMSELKIMIHLGSHVNVVNLLGACTKEVKLGELWVIVEYCRYGCLLDHLKRNRNNFINQLNSEDYFDPSIGPASELPVPNAASTETIDQENNSQPIKTHDLICWSFQISRGMGYLTSRKVLHGDLAARNVLLADDGVVKVADFGLSRDLYKSSDYTKKIKANDLLPVKWMAIESLNQRVFSTKSDVWAFGIVMWELFTLGQSPYPGMPFNKAFIKQLVDGYRMEKPDYASRQIYEIMRDCWSLVPHQRPDFAQLEESLGQLLEPETREYYLEMNDQYIQLNMERAKTVPDYLGMMAPLYTDVGRRSVLNRYDNLPVVGPRDFVGVVMPSNSKAKSSRRNENEMELEKL